MKTRIFMMTALALTLMVGNAGCNENGGSDKVPADMHQVTYQGFTFLCPDVLKPAKKLGSDEIAPNFFMLGETDLMNALMCEVSDTDVEFTREVGEQLAKEMKAKEANSQVEYRVFDDGLLIKTVSNNPDISPETLYTSMRILCKGKKVFTLTFIYSEKNKATLSRYTDVVMNSAKAVE